MKNTKGLERVITVFAGMVYAGKNLFRHHAVYEEEVFIIENKENKIIFTKAEALKIAKMIQLTFSDK
jgi:hypothetical protein